MQELCANHASLLACLMGTPTAAANPTRHYHGTGIRLLSRSMDCSPCRSRAMVFLTARTQICCTIVLELVVLYSIPHPRATALHCRIAPCQLRPEPWSLRCLGRLVAWRFSVQPFAAMYDGFYHGYEQSISRDGCCYLSCGPKVLNGRLALPGCTIQNELKSARGQQEFPRWRGSQVVRSPACDQVLQPVLPIHRGSSLLADPPNQKCARS